MTKDPKAFAQHWLDSWNAHDIDAVLEHFHDDVVFASPVAQRLLENSDGVLRGKDAVRAYWNIGIEKIPDLRFELINVYAGVDSVVIHYKNQNGGLVNEVLLFDGDLVKEGYGTYVVES